MVWSKNKDEKLVGLGTPEPVCDSEKTVGALCACFVICFHLFRSTYSLKKNTVKIGVFFLQMVLLDSSSHLCHIGPPIHNSYLPPEATMEKWPAKDEGMQNCFKILPLNFACGFL